MKLHTVNSKLFWNWKFFEKNPLLYNRSILDKHKQYIGYVN